MKHIIIYLGFLIVLNLVIYFIFSVFNQNIYFNTWSTATCVIYTIVTTILNSLISLIYGILWTLNAIDNTDYWS